VEARRDAGLTFPCRLAVAAGSTPTRRILSDCCARAANDHAAEHGYKFAPSDIGCHFSSPIADHGRRDIKAHVRRRR
jgi:hypothetical protein